jgi:hypothetical protein
MRPTPNELIAGVRDLLRDSIGPQLHAPAVVTDLKRVMAILRDLDWNEAGFALLAENRELFGLLGEIEDWVLSLARGQSAFEPFLSEMRACKQRTQTLTFADAVALNLTYRNLLGNFVDLICKEEEVAPLAGRLEWRHRLVIAFSELTAKAATGAPLRKP